MKNSLVLYLILLVVSAFCATPAFSISDDWIDEALFFALEHDEVTIGAVPNRENAMKIHGEYLYMIRSTTRGHVTKESLFRYNLETKVMYEFRFELLSTVIKFDIGANKLFVSISQDPADAQYDSRILVYDLEKNRWNTITLRWSKAVRSIKVLSDNTLLTSAPAFTCCGHILARRDLETLEIQSSNNVGDENFSHFSRLREHNDNVYFSHSYYYPNVGNLSVISFFSPINSMGNLNMYYFEHTPSDFAFIEDYVIVGGRNLAIYDYNYYVETYFESSFRPLGKLVVFDKNDISDNFAIVPNAPGAVYSLETVGKDLYFTGSILYFDGVSRIGGIASYNLESNQYNTYNGGVNGDVFSAIISDDWFIIGGKFVGLDESKSIDNIAYWDDASEEWMPFIINEAAVPGNGNTGEEEIPTAIDLNQNYPNPFNPVTQIDYDLPESSVVKLEVFNMMGQSMHTLDQGFREPGSYSLTFDATGLPSGTYVYRLTTNSQTLVRKMTLLK